MPKEFVRFRGGSALRDPESNALVVPPPDEVFDTDHPLVKAHRWAFQSDAEAADEQETARKSVSVPVEQATAAPGEKRSTRRQ